MEIQTYSPLLDLKTVHRIVKAIKVLLHNVVSLIVLMYLNNQRIKKSFAIRKTVRVDLVHIVQ